jgi:hydrogenase maturation protease
MARVLIIGYGNLLRGDDGFGWHAAERLREIIRDPDVEVLTVHQLTPELMDPIGHAGEVVFLDAAATGEPGHISVTGIAPATGGAASFTHIATPAALLAGARVLYGSEARGVMVSVAGADFTLGAGLSEPVLEATRALVDGAVRDGRWTFAWPAG